MITALLERALTWSCSTALRAHSLSPKAVRSTMKTRRQVLLQLPRRREPTIGARLLITFAIADVSLMQSLQSNGVSREHAVRIVAAANSKLISPGIWMAHRVSFLFGRTPIARISKVLSVLNGVFPFNAPAFKRLDYPRSADILAFDYTSCPLARCTTELGASDLCTAALCDLDYQIADAFNVHLERTETIATGCARCDFRWHATAPLNTDPTVRGCDDQERLGHGRNLDPAR